METFLAKPQRAQLRYARGWDDVCETEVNQILQMPLSGGRTGARVAQIRSGLEIRGASFRALCEIPLRARTLRDVRWIIHSGPAESRTTLRETIEKAGLDLFLAPDRTVRIKASSQRSRLYHTGLIESEAAAVLARFKLAVKEEPAQEIFIDLWRNTATISIGLGGESMAKRGYKKTFRSIASIKENLAACLIEGFRIWDRAAGTALEPDVIFVPFAGSGTLVIESLLSFSGIAPSVFGRSYSVDLLGCSPERSLSHARKKLAAPADWRLPQLYCVEIDFSQKEGLEQNLKNVDQKLRECGRSDLQIKIFREDIFRHSPNLEASSSLFIPLNPPFGERLGSERDLHSEYRRLGALVKELSEIVNETGGFVLCPTAAAASAFLSGSRDLISTQRAASHGGKRVTVLYFRSDRAKPK